MGGSVQIGSERPIEAYVGDALALSPEEFAARHGRAFLLLTASGLSSPAGSESTRVELLDPEEHAGARTAGVSVVVFAVRGNGSPRGDLVTVGRATNNDIVIPDLSVSRFHAFLKRDDRGQFQIQDAGSTNGTTVNGGPVATRGAAPPAPLKPGDNLRLGQVDFTFLDAETLRQYARKHAD